MAEDPRPPPAECANCGATLPPRAKSCPECGADERTGWRENSLYDGLDLPDASWSEEVDSPKKHPVATRREGLAWYWWVTGLGIIFVLIAGAIARR